ncbi:MAG: class I SAM-dependent methyltransferase [Planctomycetota bacterium]
MNKETENSKQVTEHNRRAWDAMVSKGNRWTVPVSAEEIVGAREGRCDIVLTPAKNIPYEWFMPVEGKAVLCLAGGGGQQAPMLAAAGAQVTTLDNSQNQLDQDQKVAEREGFSIESVLGVMDDLSTFEDESFDLVVHPCSNSFTPDVLLVWKEVFRVLKPGGNLLAGFINPIVHMFDWDEYEKKRLVARHKIPYSDIESLSVEQQNEFIEKGEPFWFGHSLADQIGGQTAAGFAITGFYEDDWGDENDPLSAFIDCFIATRATKPGL